MAIVGLIGEIGDLKKYITSSRAMPPLLMEEQGGVNIINIIIASNRERKNKFFYTVSKGDTGCLTLSAAVDLAPIESEPIPSA